MKTVTRQHQWPEGDYVVEVSSGGIDYCNPDALCKRYKGEFEEFHDPREAIKVAINIAKEWQKDRTSKRIKIGTGATLGYSMPFDGENVKLNDGDWNEPLFSILIENAEKEYADMDKCEQCGELLGKERYGNHEVGEYDCCSEYCAEKRWFMCEEEHESQQSFS